MAAWGSQSPNGQHGVWVFKRGQKFGSLEEGASHGEPIKSLCILGPWIIGCSLSELEVWKSSTLEHHTTIRPVSSDTRNTPLSGLVCSLPTYLNKVFVGRIDGAVEIWNISTGKLIHVITPPSPNSGPVTALEPSPALSILGIAYGNGSIHLRDIRKDHSVLKLSTNPSVEGIVNSISFRSDGLGAGEDGDESGIIATSSSRSGDVTFWDLSEKGRIKGVLRGAHSPPSLDGQGGGINKIEFLPGQDVLLTSGLDNALKSWIFDSKSLSPTPRILHSRAGHGGPIVRLLFVPTDAHDADATGKWLMSAGRDQSLWGWSLRRDGQSTEISQGNVRRKAKELGILGKGLENESSTTLEDLKAPEITAIACCLNRDGGMGAAAGGGPIWSNTNTKKNADAAEIQATGWESIVTAHRGDKHARTWLWGRKKAGRWAFESGDDSEVSAVAISICGTFALVGSEGGSLSMFNLQSGILRQRFPKPPSAAQIKKAKSLALTNGGRAHAMTDYLYHHGKHQKAVSGVCVDNLNRTVISAGLDGHIKFWSFENGSLLQDIDWSSTTSITSLHLHRPNDLIALTCDDLSIRLVDIETKKMVRELWGCLGQISDCTFSNDGRWIIAASMDGVIRTWDLPTGHLINAFRVSSPCTSLAFSDTGEYLATAHADTVGINIWNNRTLFGHVSRRPIRDDEIIETAGPTSSGEHGQNLLEAALEPASGKDGFGLDPTYAAQETPIDEISSNLLSLSLVPKSRWQTLLNLDLVRARNKPIEPPKKPEKAPFFLPSINGTKDITTTANTDRPDDLSLKPSELTRIRKMDRTSSTFTSLLASGAQNTDFNPFISHLSSLGPSAADIAIRTLELDEMPLFVDAIGWRLEQRRDFELTQTWMNVFLKLHGSVITASEEGGELREALLRWRKVQVEERKRLNDLVGYCDGVLGFLRSGR